MSSSYSWRLRIEKSGITENRVLLGLRKVTAMSQKEADHPLTLKATSPKHIQKYRHKTKNGLDKGSNGLMVPYELQNISDRQLYEGV